MLNLITHSLTAYSANIKGGAQYRRDKDIGFSVARVVDTSYKQWALHMNRYIIPSYIKYRWLNVRETYSSTLEKQLRLCCIEPSLHFVLY